jgi:hypothetical protein
LLGASNEALENPVDPAAALDATARRFLTETAAFADLDGSTSWAATLALASGRDAALGWPARLRARWLFDLFGAGPLTEGLRPSQGPLPAAVGATSFARALGAFGAALADADGPTATPARPWSTTRAPFDARPHRRAALFASLAADPVFAISALGLGRGKARDQARVVARALLIGARLDAVRVLCRGALGAPASERADRFEEATAAALGAPIPGSLAGVIPRIGPDAPARFVGTVLGIHDRRGLIDRFDEDWFRSPHAARAIREEDASSPAFPSAIPAAALDAALAEITRTIGELA